MDTFLPYINEYGYWVLIIGALIEGESILLLAGGAAYFGYFSLPMVMLVSFIGAIIHDQLLYLIGRKGGMAMFERSEKTRKKADYAFKLLKKYDYWLIMGFRFVYGVRTVTPLVIGASGLSLKRYTLLTIFSAAVWATVISTAGFLFANALQRIIEIFHTYQIYIAITLLVILCGFGLFYGLKHLIKKRTKSKDSHHA